MSMTKIKQHLKKYIIYDLITVIMIVFVFQFTIVLLNDIQENKRLENNFSSYEDTVKEAYKINPNMFKFNQNNTAYIKVDDLIYVTNGQETMYGIGVIPQTKKQDQCVGYVIVTKNSEHELEVDTSHVCDMIDY